MTYYHLLICNKTEHKLFYGRHYFLGSGSDAEIHVEHPSVSKRHAELYILEDKIVVSDLCSEYKTFVNETALGSFPVEAKLGDSIRFGGVSAGIHWNIAQLDTAQEKKNDSHIANIETDGSKEATPEATKALVNTTSVTTPSAEQSADATTTSTENVSPQQASILTEEKAAAVVSNPSESETSNAVPHADLPSLITELETIAPPPPPPPAPLAVQIRREELAEHFAYRVQQQNNNGILVVAIHKEAFMAGDTIEGWVEFTASDNESVQAISVSLVESQHKRKPVIHDCAIVHNQPWKANAGENVKKHFSLQLPQSAVASSHDVIWELRGHVDINWALDIKTASPLHVDNPLLDKLQMALGSLDYRIDYFGPNPEQPGLLINAKPPAEKEKQRNEIKSVELQFYWTKQGVYIKATQEYVGFLAGSFTEDLRHTHELLCAMSAEQIATWLDDVFTHMKTQKQQ